MLPVLMEAPSGAENHLALESNEPLFFSGSFCFICLSPLSSGEEEGEVILQSYLNWKFSVPVAGVPQ